MSTAIDVNDHKLWTTYKDFADDSGKGGDLDDLFDEENEDEDEEDADGSSSKPDDDEDDDAPAASSEDEDGDEEDDSGKGSEPEDEDEESDEPDLPNPNASGDEDDEDDSEEESDQETDEAGDEEAPHQEAEGGDNAGPSGDISVTPMDFDESLAQAISDDAKESMMDAEYRIYTRDHDVIEPLKINEATWKDVWLTQLEDETRGMVGVMQKDLERMMAARSQVIRVPGYRSGRLHSSGLHRIAAGDDRVFRRKHENTSNDTAVSLLCDNSGSMGGQKMLVAMTAAYALSTTLERVKVKHEVLGFTTGYERSLYKEVEEEQKRIGKAFSRVMPIIMPIYKGFEERMGPEIKRRFAGAPRQSFMNANVDSESVEYAATRLLKRPEKRKVLIVMSDGMPAADGDHYEQIAHLHRVVRAVGTQGIELVGIGILSDAVKKFYPRHFILNKVEQLPGMVMGELKRILTA